MDRGPPEPKRMRTDVARPPALWSSSESSSGSARYPPPHQHAYPNTISLPPPQGPPHPPRRHSEYNYSTEDSRRPPPPSRSPYDHGHGGYSSRESTVKRDLAVAERPQLQEVRPHSTGRPIDNRPKQEDMRGPGYEHTVAPGGSMYPPSPAGYIPHPSHMGTPHLLHSPASFNSYDGRPPPPVFDTHSEQQQQVPVEYMGSVSSTQKKRAARTTQACDACRLAKAKCTDPKPCQGCREKGIQCKWEAPPPKLTDKLNSDLVNRITSLEQSLSKSQDSVQKKLDRNQKRYDKKLAQVVNRLEQMQRLLEAALSSRDPELAQIIERENGFAAAEVKSEDEEDDGSVQASIEGADEDVKTPVDMTQEQVQPTEQMTGVEQNGADEGHSYYEEMVPEAGADADAKFEKSNAAKLPVVVEAPDSSAIPKGHSTGASQILTWESVYALLKGQLEDERILKYEPQTIEINRGILRLYGVGEGFERPSSYDRNWNRSNASAISGDSATSSALESCWGKMGPGSPFSEGPSCMLSHPQSGLLNTENLDRNKMPPFDEQTVRELVQVYMKTFNCMHPIITAKGNDIMVRDFLKQTGEVRITEPIASESVGFVGQGAKRKRASPSNTVVRSNDPLGVPQRSIATCIVLLMLALGKICEHRERIPDTPQEPDAAEAFLRANGVPSPSPILQSPQVAQPGSQAQAQGNPSPRDTRDWHHRPWSATSGSRYPPGTRNVDVIPGLGYFAMATDILGNHKGYNSLQYVHANLLAGLYYGQLGCIMQNHACLSEAGYAMGVILEPSLKRFKAMTDVESAKLLTSDERQRRRDNHILFAYWTCLQLESDIVAELTRIPQSAVLKLEQNLPWPDVKLAVRDGDFATKDGECYLAQLYLRKNLNQIHRDFYGPGKVEQYSDKAVLSLTNFTIFDETVTVLDSILNLVPTLKWDELDPPAENLNEARLRGKMYGGRVITYRHCLRAVLNHPFKPPQQRLPIPRTVLNNARKCVTAMISSCQAFLLATTERGGGRLIVTNAWGTSHAQWGNVIVLHAVYACDLLKGAISKDLLSWITGRVREFLVEVAHPRSALEWDLRVLDKICEATGVLPDSYNLGGPPWSPLLKPKFGSRIGEGLSSVGVGAGGSSGSSFGSQSQGFGRMTPQGENSQMAQTQVQSVTSYASTMPGAGGEVMGAPMVPGMVPVAEGREVMGEMAAPLQIPGGGGAYGPPPIWPTTGSQGPPDFPL